MINKTEERLLKMNLQLFSEEQGAEDETKEANEGQEQEQKQEGQKEKTVEELIAEAIAEEQKKNEAERDRRINQARAKWEKEQEEKERLAKLTEEERIKEIEKQKEEALQARERELELKTAKLDILENLKNAGLLDAESIFKPENYIKENKEQLAKDIESLNSFIKAEVAKQVEDFKQELLKGKTPAINDKKQGAVTKEQFAKMSYKERVAIYNTNPELYKELTK